MKKLKKGLLALSLASVLLLTGCNDLDRVSENSIGIIKEKEYIPSRRVGKSYHSAKHYVTVDVLDSNGNVYEEIRKNNSNIYEMYLVGDRVRLVKTTSYKRDNGEKIGESYEFGSIDNEGTVVD